MRFRRARLGGLGASLARLQGLLGEPPGIQLMVTTGCGQRCSYCYQSPAEQRVVAPEVVEQVVAALLRFGHARSTLHFFGGEPLLRLDVIRAAVRLLRQSTPPGMRPQLRVTTNGALLDRDAAAYLAAEGFHVTLSLDGGEAAQELRAPGTFPVVDSLLVDIAEGRSPLRPEQVRVKATLTSANVGVLGDSIRYLLERGAVDIDLVPLATHDAGWDGVATAELDRQLGEARAFCQGHRRMPLTVLRDRAPDWHASGRMCGVGCSPVLFVDVDGTVAPCSLLARSCLPAPPPLIAEAIAALGVGSIGDTTLPQSLEMRREAVAGLRMFNAREAKRTAGRRCADCEARDQCFVCPASIGFAVGNDNPDRVPENQCAFNRVTARHRALLAGEHRFAAEARSPGRGRPVAAEDAE